GLPAEVAAQRTGRRSVFTGPAVSSRFDADGLPDREEGRARFGIGPDQRAVLIVAGSWGIGNVAATFSAVARDDRFLPVVVCGRDDKLRRHVTALAGEAPGAALILGWTEDMPALMVACDALVENAGGLTSLEAMRVGLPVVSFDPIAGHGVENTTAMDAAGVARLARDPLELSRALAELTEPGHLRDAQAARAGAMFRSSPASAVLDAVGSPILEPSAARRRLGLAFRTAVAGVATAAVGWAGLTTGVAMATDAGAGVAHPVRMAVPVAYLGVRLTAAQVCDPAVRSSLRRLQATAVVDDATVEATAPQVRSLVADGVTVANGGVGTVDGVKTDHDLPWDRAARDAQAGRQISQLIDAPVTQAVPGRRLTAWDLMDYSHAHTALVVPNHVLHVVAGDGQIRLAPRNIYLVDGSGATPQQLTSYLDRFEAGLRAAQLISEPLASLG
ncbi:MAG TPA: glycosyltransferase, partial [Acidimicrobiales bacterium]|nr:glycosyltransferase [Acidimicrobiales bacterium]